MSFEHVFDREAIGVCVTATDARPEQRLVLLVDELAVETPADLPASVSLERTRLLLAQADRLRTLALQGLSDVESRQLFALDDAPSTTAWVRAQPVAGLSARDVTLARRLNAVPRVQQEVLAGRLPSAAGAVVTTAVLKATPFLDRPDGLIDGQPAEPALRAVLVDGIVDLLCEQRGGGLSEQEVFELRSTLEAVVESDTPQRTRWEAALVVLAERSAPALLTSSLALLLDALLPAEHDARARRAEEEAQLLLQRRHGGSGWTVSGQLDDETGELLAAVVRALQAVDQQAVNDTEAWRAAGADDVADLEPEHWPSRLARPRSRRQQAHDALKEGLRSLLDSGVLGTRGKTAPHVGITVGLDFVEAVPGALPGRTVSGARWSRTQVRRLLTRSTFTRLVLDARRRVVEVSHTARTLTAVERQILHVEWGWRCAVRACTRGPSTWDLLVPHHGTLFSRTGTTSLRDAVPLCQRDHHALHDQQRTLRLADGRVIGPQGWVEPDARAG